MISPELLRRYPCFTAGGQYAINAMANFAERVDLKPGELVLVDGERADMFYVIVSGSVDIEATLGDGSVDVVDTLVDGDLLGWSSVFHGQQYNANAVAKGDVLLIGLDASKLRALCNENVRLGYRLMSEVVKAVGHRLQGARLQLAACQNPG